MWNITNLLQTKNTVSNSLYFTVSFLSVGRLTNNPVYWLFDLVDVYNIHVFLTYIMYIYIIFKIEKQ